MQLVIGGSRTIIGTLLIHKLEARQDTADLAVLSLNNILVIAGRLRNVSLHAFRRIVRRLFTLLDLVV